MSFLNLWALWIAAGVVPTLLILYFLKLRRRQEPVSSTLLWKRAIQDLQVNAPFQKLRKNLLLLLQLLVLSAAIIALARPIVATEKAEEDRIVILIDRSASMNTIEPPDSRTRLEIAKEQAIRRIKTYNRTGSRWFSFVGPKMQTQVMVIAFADRATVVSPFTTNTSELEELVRRIEPTDAPTDLREAFKLAQAYMSPPAMTTDEMVPGDPNNKTPVPSESPARMVLFSDGRVGRTDDLVLTGGAMEWVKIGQTDDNAGITTLRARRNYEQPEILEMFVKVQNFAGAPSQTDVSLYVDGILAAVRSVSLAGFKPEARTTAPSGGDDAAAGEASRSEAGGDDTAAASPSSASLSFELPLDRAAVVEARLSRADMLSVDNSAAAVIPPPRKLRVLVVTAGNFFLDSVLRGLPLEESPFVTPQQYEAARGDYEIDGQSKYDVVIFDKYAPPSVPAGSYLFLAAPPPIPEIKAGEEATNHPLIWWDETHPALRHVGLDFVYVGKSNGLILPREAEVLIEGPKGPLLARFAKDARNYMSLAFAIENTTWWSKPSFPVFVYNVIRYLSGGGTDVEQGPTRPGATLRIPLKPGTTEAKIVEPDGESAILKPDLAGMAHFSGTRRAGIYRVEPGIEGRDKFAVNLEDDWESRIAPPAQTLEIGGTTVKEGRQIQAATPEIWRWFIGAALLVALFEWYIYNRRVMI
jgi:hypothetical protein